MQQNGSACIVTRETLEGFSACWSSGGAGLHWSCLFMLPLWIEPWLEHFGGRKHHIYKITEGGELLGFAPLFVKDDEASLIGSPDVCDYFDFIVAPGRQKDFFSALVLHLRHEGIARLDLGPLRPDSAALACCTGAAAQFASSLSSAHEDVSYELALPADWDGYLSGLAVQQRHEVRRKLRRLQEAGPFAYRSVDASEAIDAAMDSFLHLFTISRPDKRAFMTAAREAFFRSLARSMASWGLVRLGFLDIDGEPAAAVMCFDYRGTVYLYNSGFDPRFRHLNAGLLCKVLSIRYSIQRGNKVYDFLKGAEPYKQRLGGRPVPLQRRRLLL
ncbi:MAG: GNAT family N-acetyltransferase [Deltaproteobacteria bacterium]|nr:GNAT family N-acetyltransferase [Deltaproteobacteria bacterium]